MRQLWHHRLPTVALRRGLAQVLGLPPIAMPTDTSQLAAKAIEIQDILSKEGDRGCVLVAAALLEEAIELHLRARLVPPPGKSDELITSSAVAPISSFSAKIDLGYRVGLFPENERAIYHQLRKLRNECAHSTTEQDFSQTTFKTRIKNMIAASSGVWEVMRARFGPLLGEHQAPDSVDAFVEQVGWRRAFILFYGLVIAHKLVNVHRVQRVGVLYGKA